jgi:hypothetical protein
VERSEAEAIYDSGREACVEFLIGSTVALGRSGRTLELATLAAVGSAKLL